MKQPSAEQKRWMERVAQFAETHGSFPKYESNQFQIHHVVGRSYKQNKIPIGHWFILPIEPEYHDVSSNNPFNVTHWRRRYCVEFGWQADQFKAMCMVILDEDGRLPFDNDVLDAIMDTRY